MAETSNTVSYAAIGLAVTVLIAGSSWVISQTSADARVSSILESFAERISVVEGAVREQEHALNSAQLSMLRDIATSSNTILQKIEAGEKDRNDRNTITDNRLAALTDSMSRLAASIARLDERSSRQLLPQGRE